MERKPRRHNGFKHFAQNRGIWRSILHVGEKEERKQVPKPPTRSKIRSYEIHRIRKGQVHPVPCDEESGTSQFTIEIRTSLCYTHGSTSADWQSVARRVIVLTNKEIQAMLIRYPDGVNKEMFRKICHISPRMAQYLLETQLVPCEIKAQRTHRYWIATADMVAYLRDREKHPERYFYPNQRDNGEHEPKRKHRRIKDRPSKYQLQALTDSDYAQACLEAVENCPDVMTIEQARRIIGYSYKSYLSWIQDKKLICVNIRGQHLVPRLALYEFMLSSHFRSIPTKSDRHWELLSSAVKHQKDSK